jgi:hypothetical protein
MKRTFLPLTLLLSALLGMLVLGASLGWAQENGPVPDARPTATPAVALPEQEEPSSPEIPNYPDLIVERIEFYPADPVVNETVRIRVTIANQGVTDVNPGNNFWTDLYIDPTIVPIQLGQNGVFAWPCQSFWVPAGGSFSLEMTHVFTDVKVYSLYAQVDTDGHVPEGNENNNVLGPIEVLVETRDVMTWQTHQDFQMGLASSLDISHPDGVIRRGLFDESPDDLNTCSSDPDAEGVYSPDTRLNDTVYGDIPPSTVSQVKPALTGDGQGRLFAVWEDNRHSYFNRDIYFARSDDGGENWGANVQVTTDTAQQASPDLVYANGNLFAVWQDEREGNYDIYGAVSSDFGDHWTELGRINDDVGTAGQMNPSIDVGPLGGVYVVWQDRRNNNDDVYLARWVGDHWSENYFVTDDPQMRLQNQVAPSIGVSTDGSKEIVYVTWEDWRDPAHPEVYVARSEDQGKTFGIDVPVDITGESTSYRRAPSIVVSRLLSGTVGIDTIHVGWQQGEDENADVYWAFAVYPPDEADPCPWPYEFCFGEPAMINGFVIDSEYVRPPDAGPSWSIEPSWQGQVSLTPAHANDLTWCHANNNEDIYSDGVFLAWSDGASYDDWRYEIQTRRVGCIIEVDPVRGFDVRCEPCEDAGTGVVNNNVKLYAYRNDLDKYSIFGPAAAGLFNPSIYAQPPSNPWIPELHLAWDDDRWDEPEQQGTVRNRDVYYTRSGYTSDQAVFISDPIDVRTQATWYALSWWGATQHAGDLLMQTRFGSTPHPPRCNEAIDGWTKWTGNPSAIYADPPFNGCDAGADCYYDAPGRPIVDPDGNIRPESRYIQYKVIIRQQPGLDYPDRLTALSQVTVYYEGPILRYLPIVIRKH